MRGKLEDQVGGKVGVKLGANRVTEIRAEV